jgi:hypothetical protein
LHCRIYIYIDVALDLLPFTLGVYIEWKHHSISMEILINQYIDTLNCLVQIIHYPSSRDHCVCISAFISTFG